MKFFKLLKYEFLENIASIALINGILLVLMLAIKLLVASDSFMDLQWILALLIPLVPLGIFSSIIFLGIVIIKSLYSRLFSTEAYLTLSLPVGLDSILISKIVVSSIWILISVLVVIIWILLIASIEIYFFRNFFAMIGGVNILYTIYCLWILLLWTIKPIVAILLVLSILNIGKIKRFKPLMGVIIFFTIMLLENLTFGLIKAKLYEIFVYVSPTIEILGIEKLFGLLMYDIANNSWLTTFKVILIENFITIATILLYYFISRYLIKNKLEI